LGIEALRSAKVNELEARLKEEGYSEKVIREIIRWYQS